MNKETIVAGKTFLHPFADSLLAMTEEINQIKHYDKEVNADAVEHVKKLMNGLIGIPTKFSKNYQYEPILVQLEPDTYANDIFIKKWITARDARHADILDDMPAFLAAMHVGEYKPVSPDLKAKSEEIAVIIVDIALHPSGDFYFKAVNLANGEVGWFPSDAFAIEASTILDNEDDDDDEMECDGDCEHCVKGDL